MRRGRHKLQVSTFPFLAVLLAAMGSLILLLLVMDRRAKIVARNKAREVLAAREQRSEEAEEKRRRDWERERAALHAQLTSQVQDLVERQAKERGQSEQLAGQIRLEQERLQALQDQLLQDKATLTKEQQALQQRQSLLAKKDVQGLELLAERERLAAQLAQLEAAWRDLQLLQGKEQNTFSLVAYRGKRGENRQPIYVECRDEGIVFHPTGKRLGGPTLTDENFRQEVKAQGATLEEHPSNEPRARKRPPAPLTGPYVLFLVRPDAIETYYSVATALRGYKIDFGYELIERDWVLDFPSAGGDQGSGVGGQGSGVRGQGSGVGNQGSRVGGQGAGGREQGSGIGSQESGVRSQGKGGGGQGTQGGEAQLDELGGGVLAWRPQGSRIGTSTSGPGNGGGTSAGEGERSMSGGGYRAGEAGEWRTGFGSSVPAVFQGGRADGFPSTKFGTPPLGSFAHGRGGSNVAAQSGGSSAPGDDLNSPPREGIARSPSSVASARPANRDWPPGDPGDGNSVAGPTKGQSGQGSEMGRKPGASLTVPTPRLPSDPSNAGTEPDEPANPANPRKPRINMGGGAQGGETDPLNRLPLPELPQKAPAAAKPGPPVRVLGVRDFVISIECYEDSCAVYPGGRVFAAIGAADQDTQAIANYVQLLIARRQASVRPGDPPYRPQLRFQVQPDGLRTYFRVFPALESLRLPMSRENISE